MTDTVQPIAFVRDLGDLADKLRKRRQQLGWTQMDLCDRTGLQDGYVGKLEAWRTPKTGRRLNYLSMPLMLEALGLGLQLVRIRRVPRPREPDPRQLVFPLKGGQMNRQPLAHHEKAPPDPECPEPPPPRAAGSAGRQARKS